MRARSNKWLGWWAGKEAERVAKQEQIGFWGDGHEGNLGWQRRRGQEDEDDDKEEETRWSTSGTRRAKR